MNYPKDTCFITIVEKNNTFYPDISLNHCSYEIK